MDKPKKIEIPNDLVHFQSKDMMSISGKCCYNQACEEWEVYHKQEIKKMEKKLNLSHWEYICKEIKELEQRHKQELANQPKPFLCKCRKDDGAMTVKVVNDDFLECPRCGGLFVRGSNKFKEKI